VICYRRSLIPSVYSALKFEFLVRIGVQFILGKPSIVPSDVLRLPEYEATVELGLAGAYLDVIPCNDGTLGLYVGSGCGQGGLSRRFRDYMCDSKIGLSSSHRELLERPGVGFYCRSHRCS
jgi:hypothetical protein